MFVEQEQGGIKRARVEPTIGHMGPLTLATTSTPFGICSASGVTQRLSVTDCTSFAVMTLMKLDTASALDQNLKATGWTVLA